MRGAVLSNSVILLVLVTAGVLSSVDPDLFYRAGQEDGVLEWATFWAFVLAAIAYFRNAAYDRRTAGGVPWFAVGLGLFCAFVALEEISWGQRLFGYQPPDYFLEENFQQEFNLHNVTSTSLRKFILLLILAGYGVVSALLSLVPAIRKLMRQLRIVPAPVVLIPSFLVMSVIYEWYPWRYTGEWIELTMGLGFLFAALHDENTPAEGRTAARIGMSSAATAALAVLTVFAQPLLRPSDEVAHAMAVAEIEALAIDFASPKVRTRCGLHKRLYTFMRDYKQPHLVEGAFAGQLREAGEQDRADYLLDPWNSPYWLRHKCKGGRVAVFVYSFGPNRQRDSSEWAIGGDDIGQSLREGR